MEPSRTRLELLKPLLAAIIALIVVLIYLKFGQRASWADDTLGWYSAFLFLQSTRLIFACGLFPVVFVAIVVTILRRISWTTRHISVLISDFLAIAIILFGGFLALMLVFSVVFNDYHRIDSARLDDHLYFLAAFNTYDDMGFETYVLYRCDTSGLDCREIYEISRGLWLWIAPAPTFEERGQAELILNTAARTVSIQIDGETAYTYYEE